jgi:hypothetical protein
MKKKRILTVAAFLVTLIGMPALVLALLPPRTGVTKGNFDRVEKGMTKAEVLGIFGEPPKGSALHGGLKIRHICETWSGGGGVASITFDEAHERVADTEWTYSEEPFLQRILHFLPWK